MCISSYIHAFIHLFIFWLSNTPKWFKIQKVQSLPPISVPWALLLVLVLVLVLVSCISFQYFVYLQANVSQTFLSEKILVLAWASITKYHRLGGINNRNLFQHHSGGWVTVLAGWDLVRTLFLLCRWCLVLCPYAEETEWSRSLVSLLISELSTHMILFKCDYYPKDPF